MTLQQLKYVIEVAKAKSISEAAKKLFISQPSLTNAIKELEKEMNITIFLRTNKGILISKEGEIFLGYARQVLEQAYLLEEKYLKQDKRKQQFCVSTQHYSFAVNAFVDIIKEYGHDEYDFSLRETQTYEIIEDVTRMKSEIGVLYIKPHIFISSKNPLAKKKKVTMEELRLYPYLSFEQGEHNSFYYSEEIFSSVVRYKNIRVRDRATLFNLLIGLNGYTVCSGIIDENLNGKDIVAVALDKEGEMNIGYITRKDSLTSDLANAYIEALKQHVNK